MTIRIEMLLKIPSLSKEDIFAAKYFEMMKICCDCQHLATGISKLLLGLIPFFQGDIFAFP